MTSRDSRLAATGRVPSGIVAFDGSILGNGPPTGVARAFLSTLAHYTESSSLQAVLLAPRGLKQSHDIPALPGVRIVACLPPRGWHRRRTLQRAVLDCGADLLHSPILSVPRLSCPSIVTVHDLPWRHPELRAEPGSRLRARWALIRDARRASGVIVPSLATRRDLQATLRLPEARVHTIPHGMDAPPTQAQAADLTGPFLVLGDNRIRKNLARIRAAHAQARRLDPSLPDLNCVGPGFGFVTETQKQQLLTSTRALVQVSLLEGFGLPVLEAMAHGVPVICSNETSQPEVAGRAGLQVNPRDEEAITAAFLRVHQDEPERARQIAAGLEQASRFPATATARAWSKLHRECLRDRARPD